MSDIELVITHSKKLEALLEKHFKATGKGLHEKVSSVERRLPEPLVRKLRFVATIRNKIVHDEDYDQIDDRKRFIESSTTAHTELRKLAGLRSPAGKLKWIAIGIALGVAIYIYFKFIH